MQNVFIPAHFTSYRILKRKHSRVFQQSFNNSNILEYSTMPHLKHCVVSGTPPTHQVPEQNKVFQKNGTLYIKNQPNTETTYENLLAPLWASYEFVNKRFLCSFTWMMLSSCSLLSGARPMGYDLNVCLRTARHEESEEDDVSVCQVHFPASRM